MQKASDTLKTRILLTALRDVPFEGWTDAVLEKAARANNAAPEALFPRGALDLVLYFSGWADARIPPAKKLEPLRVRDRVGTCVRARLEALAPHRQAVAKSLSFLGPLRLPKLVWATAHEIWRASGDTATDYNHYTKRILLSGVLSATTLFWLNDDSAGHEKTWEFLDRRIAEVLKVGGALGRLKKKKA
jgi:ubiquinone biosynthesis protein COQ9